MNGDAHSTKFADAAEIDVPSTDVPNDICFQNQGMFTYGW